MSRPLVIDPTTGLPELLVDVLPAWVCLRDGVLVCQRCGGQGMWRAKHGARDARRFGRQHAACLEARSRGLGKRLAQARLEFGASLEEIARETGLSVVEVVAAELDESGIVTEAARRLADWLGVAV